MPPPPSASLIDALPGLTLGALDPAAGNRIAFEGLAATPQADGALELGMRKLEAASLRLAWGALVLEIAQLVLHDVVALVRAEAGRLRVVRLQAAGADVSGVKLQGPLSLPSSADGSHRPTDAGRWRLDPLATAEGTLRAEIVDAHLLFDADVTVTIRQGGVDFNKATVEHVGPDSRMGASRLGLYVDAPNGRSYLYQFPSTPFAGVAYERRDALLGPFVSNRGSLQLQPFVEALLQQHPAGTALGLTEQARALFERTAASGDVQLGDGPVAAAGVQAELVGRAEGRNVVRVHSEAVGRGLTLDLAALSARAVALAIGPAGIRCDEASGALQLRLLRDGTQLRFAIDLPQARLAGLRVEPGTPAA
jgi:hypothetical protein